MQEQGFWRLAIALGLGLVGAAGAAVTVSVLGAIKRNPLAVILPGVATAATAYAIDWYTEKKGQ